MTDEVKILVTMQGDGSFAASPGFEGVGVENAYAGEEFEMTFRRVSQRKARNLKMNACLHKFCQMAADAMNRSGWDMVKVFSTHKPECDVPWQMEDVKERMFKPVLGAIAESDKTSKATNAELCEVEKRLGKFFAEKLGIVVEWPSNNPPLWRSSGE